MVKKIERSDNILYHGTSAEAAKCIREFGGFTDKTAAVSKGLTGLDVDTRQPISLSRDRATAEAYVNPRPDGEPGELLAFSADNLNIASEKDIKELSLMDLKSSEPEEFRAKLKKSGYDGYDTSSPHDELVETIVFNKEKLRLLTLSL